MNPRPVALLAALLPFVAVHATYFVAASHDLVDWCIPYIDSCTSISATGRKAPASYLFRATMLPSAVIMMGYWWLNHAFLSRLRVETGTGSARSARWMLGLGLLACVGLILYVTVLGEAGDTWKRQRRIGTVLFFSFTYICQLILYGQLRRAREAGGRLPGPPLQWMWRLCILLLALGLLTVILDAWDEMSYESVEDAFEWVLTLLLQLNFFLGYLVWRHHGWQLEAVAGQSGPAAGP